MVIAGTAAAFGIVIQNHISDVRQHLKLGHFRFDQMPDAMKEEVINSGGTPHGGIQRIARYVDVTILIPWKDEAASLPFSA